MANIFVNMKTILKWKIRKNYFAKRFARWTLNWRGVATWHDKNSHRTLGRNSWSNTLQESIAEVRANHFRNRCNCDKESSTFSVLLVLDALGRVAKTEQLFQLMP